MSPASYRKLDPKISKQDAYSPTTFSCNLIVFLSSSEILVVGKGIPMACLTIWVKTVSSSGPAFDWHNSTELEIMTTTSSKLL